MALVAMWLEEREAGPGLRQGFRGQVLRSELESGREDGGGDVDEIPSGRENGWDSGTD